MSINNYILNLLNIKDENIYIVKETKDDNLNFSKYIFINIIYLFEYFF